MFTNLQNESLALPLILQNALGTRQKENNEWLINIREPLRVSPNRIEVLQDILLGRQPFKLCRRNSPARKAADRSDKDTEFGLALHRSEKCTLQIPNERESCTAPGSTELPEKTDGNERPTS